MGRDPADEVESAGFVQRNDCIAIVVRGQRIRSIAALEIRLRHLQNVVISLAVVEIQRVAHNEFLRTRPGSVVHIR